MRSLVHFQRSLAAILIFAAAACKSSSEPTLSVAAAKAHWAARQPAAYVMTIRRSCECLPETIGPVEVTVRNGAVQSRIYAQSGSPVLAQYNTAFPTVDGLFAMLDEGIAAGTSPITAQFESNYGYPTRVAIGDPATDAPEYFVTAFHVLN